jgi:hypothetical protein
VLVVALRGKLDVDLVGAIDSINGGIRTRFDSVPDAPISKFVLTMDGGRKSLLVNSMDICHVEAAAALRVVSHDGRTHDARAPLRAPCRGSRNPRK